jgi:hypothetical protein
MSTLLSKMPPPRGTSSVRVIRETAASRPEASLEEKV